MLFGANPSPGGTGYWVNFRAYPVSSSRQMGERNVLYQITPTKLRNKPNNHPVLYSSNVAALGKVVERKL